MQITLSLYLTCITLVMNLYCIYLLSDMKKQFRSLEAFFNYPDLEELSISEVERVEREAEFDRRTEEMKRELESRPLPDVLHPGVYNLPHSKYDLKEDRIEYAE